MNNEILIHFLKRKIIRIFLFLATTTLVINCSSHEKKIISAPLTINQNVKYWIDTDAMLLDNQTSDIDDILALMLAQNSLIDIIGISTIHGNGSKNDTWNTVSKEFEDYPIFKGDPELGCQSRAVVELRRALENQKLTIVALGPADNIHAVIKCYPDVNSKIDRIIFVGGRKKGEKFFLSNSITIRPLRDLNYQISREKFETVAKSSIPIELSPFSAGNSVRLSTIHLSLLPARIRRSAESWIALLWLIGGEGELPAFDPTAMALAIWPHLFNCEFVQLKFYDINLYYSKTIDTSTTIRACHPRDPKYIRQIIWYYMY